MVFQILGLEIRSIHTVNRSDVLLYVLEIIDESKLKTNTKEVPAADNCPYKVKRVFVFSLNGHNTVTN